MNHQGSWPFREVIAPQTKDGRLCSTWRQRVECGIISVMQMWHGSGVVVGAGVALIFALAVALGYFVGGAIGMFACALLAAIACGALVANDEKKT